MASQNEWLDEHIILHATTADLSDILWRDWHKELGLQPSINSPFTKFRRGMLCRIQHRIFVTCKNFLERQIDPDESLRIFIETLLRFTCHRPYVRYVIVRRGLRFATRLEHAKMIVEFAKSVPTEELDPQDIPMHRLVACSGNQLFADAGAPTTRLHPTDPSLLIDTSEASAQLLLREGESPDDHDDRCRALEQLFMGCCGNSISIVTEEYLPSIVALVWFSDLRSDQLLRAVRTAFTEQASHNYHDVSSSMSEEIMLAIMLQYIGLRDTLRALVDTRRRVSLMRQFRKSPLRLLPLHIAIRCLEFVVIPAASKPWIQAWYHHSQQAC